jgi:hypothetical protein
VQQRADDFFGIVGVHLAAEGFDVEGFFHYFYCSGECGERGLFGLVGPLNGLRLFVLPKARHAKAPRC